MNKKQYVYDTVRSRIIEGVYKPGYRVIIDQIAKELGTSIIPVREAIRQLESDGLIQFKPYSGAIVSTINDTEYLETLSVLAVLEGYGAALAASSITKKDIENLKELNNRIKNAIEELDFEACGNLNLQFHLQILDNCHNRFLTEQIQQVRERMDVVRKSIFTIVPQRLRKSVKEHDYIISLFEESASFQKIEEIVRDHKMNTVRAFQDRNNK